MNNINIRHLADFVKKWEGLRLEAYRCSAGKWTIGYGHTSEAGPPSVSPGQTISRQEAEDILLKDLSTFIDSITPLIKVSLTASQWTAAISLAFNIGPTNFRSSTFLKRLNAKDFKGAAEALTWWNKATVDGKKVVLKGLVNRREDERSLFLMTDDTVEVEVETVETPQSDELKPMTTSKTQALSFVGLLTAVGGFVTNLPTEVILPVIAVIFVAFLVNRWMDRRKGIH